MNATKTLIIGIVLVLVGIGVFSWSRRDVDDRMMERGSTKNGIMEDGGTMTNEEDSTGTMMEDEGEMMNAGSYESYSPEKIARAAEGDVVLFFRATWCPTCRALDADIRAHLDDIPAGVTILDVDYDNSTALKQKYGVTYQHTLVQVDASGNLIAKWTGSPTLANIVASMVSDM